MNDNKATANVIQFPGGKKKEAAPKSPKAPATPPKAPHNPGPKSARPAAMAGSVLAIILFTGAVNRFAFQAKPDALDLSSNSRAIASVDKTTYTRDAAWEKQLAERLASTQVRTPASNGIGHDATAEEKLRWGTLEEKYTILYKSDIHKIDTITLQDPTSTNPAYVLDRRAFLKEYGALLQEGFTSAQLNSVEVSHDGTVESYLLYDKSKKATVQARFELDVHKRLLSLKVEPVRI